MDFPEPYLLLCKTLLAPRYRMDGLFIPKVFKAFKQVHPLFECEGCRTILQVNAKIPADSFELLAGEKIFEGVSQGWLPSRKTVYDKVVEALLICVQYHGRPPLAETQQDYIHAWNRRKILAPETMHQLHLEPRL